METVCMPDAFPDAFKCVYMAQFEDVKNGVELREALIAASKTPDGSEERARMDLAFIDARLVHSRQQLMTAIMQAMIGAMRRDVKGDGEADVGLKTPSIHSDILWTLNPNNNIADALRRFGVSASTSTLILVRVAQPPPHGPEPRELVTHMTSLVDGKLQTRGLCLPTPSPIPPSTWKDLGKAYKLQDALAFQDHNDADLDALVCSIVATKYVGT